MRWLFTAAQRTLVLLWGIYHGKFLKPSTTSKGTRLTWHSQGSWLTWRHLSEIKYGILGGHCRKCAVSLWLSTLLFSRGVCPALAYTCTCNFLECRHRSALALTNRGGVWPAVVSPLCNCSYICGLKGYVYKGDFIHGIICFWAYKETDHTHFVSHTLTQCAMSLYALRLII